MATLNSTAIEFDVITHQFKEIAIDDIVINQKNLNKIYWIHCNLHQQTVFTHLIKLLNLPEEVVEFCKQEAAIHQVVDNDQAITILTQSVVTPELLAHAKLEFSNLVLHLTPQFCFTASSEPLSCLLEFIKSTPKTVKYAKTPCFILFLIFDDIINDYSKILFNLELLADQMDVKVRTMHRNIYNKVMDVKQQVMRIKHYVVSVREILMRLSTRKIAAISEQCQSSLHNLSTHTHMVANESDSIRDILNGLLDQIDNNLMQDMNKSIRVLTAFAAIFLPLTLITGIYGMNFMWMPELKWQYGYAWALGLILVCGIVLFYIFKKKKWF